jgi:hypothetical protein
MSVFHDLAHGSPGMDPVVNFIESHGQFASSCGRVLSRVRDKPILRCENCTKSSKEIGPDVRFMICSKCKSKLGFVVHYCS